jgi:hypothetical protein
MKGLERRGRISIDEVSGFGSIFECGHPRIIVSLP